MVEGGTVKGAEGGDLRRWCVRVRVGGEDDVPAGVEVVDFGCPEVGGVVCARRRSPKSAGFGGVPRGEGAAAIEGDVHVVGEGEIVVAITRLDHPAESRYVSIAFWYDTWRLAASEEMLT